MHGTGGVLQYRRISHVYAEEREGVAQFFLGGWFHPHLAETAISFLFFNPRSLCWIFQFPRFRYLLHSVSHTNLFSILDLCRVKVLKNHILLPFKSRNKINGFCNLPLKIRVEKFQFDFFFSFVWKCFFFSQSWRRSRHGAEEKISSCVTLFVHRKIFVFPSSENEKYFWRASKDSLISFKESVLKPESFLKVWKSPADILKIHWVREFCDNPFSSVLKCR